MKTSMTLRVQTGAFLLGTCITVFVVSAFLLAYNVVLTKHLVDVSEDLLSRQALQLAAGYPEGLYLGNDKVLCYVRPLGRSMVLESADKGMTVHLCRGLGWEPSVSRVMSRLIKQGDVVVDVGANVGYYTLLYVNKVGPNGHVMAIEPVPRTFELLSQTVELNGLSSNVTIINKAAYNKVGLDVVVTTSTERPLNNHILSHVCKEGKCNETLVDEPHAIVKTITIDALLADKRQVNIIKVDVQGEEAAVYAGMATVLKRFPKVIVVMEVNTARMGLKEAKTFYEQLLADFPHLRKISGNRIVTTTVDDLLSNTAGDDIVVLTRQPGSLDMQRSDRFYRVNHDAADVGRRMDGSKAEDNVDHGSHHDAVLIPHLNKAAQSGHVIPHAQHGEPVATQVRVADAR